MSTPRDKSQGFVAEIIGPAGAGKSSLSRLLEQRSLGTRAGLSVWRLPSALLAVNSLGSLPNLLGLCAGRRRIGWDEVKLVIQLNALRQLLQREAAKGYLRILLDEGMVFALARLRARDQQDVAVRRPDWWMQGLFNRLGPTLDAVIWLDAPDAVLARRIRERAKPHRMKDRSDMEIYEHLAGYRRSFEWVVSELSAGHGVKVIRFSTDRESLEEIADKVLSGASEKV